MKKFFLILAMVMGISIVGAAQSSDAKVQREGNCIFVTKTDTAKVSKQKAEPVYTGFTTKDPKGTVREVYQGSRGGLFYLNDKGKRVYDIDPDVKQRILAAMKEGGTK